jgi:CHAT domain-containing protein/Tfp pilus assembly protein PilF
VHSELGDYEAALSKSQSSIDLLQKIFDAGTQDKRLRSLKGRVLHNMAFAYFRSGEITRSIEFYGRALSLREDVGDRLGESRSLNSLGFAYAALGQHEQALANLERAIAITREERDRRNEGRTLDSIASVYMQTGQHGEALKLLYEAMVIKQEVDDRGGQQATLANIGRVFLDQGHTQLAIVFLKKSVEMVEQIKVDLGTLPKSMRQAYTDSVADTYRLLADLLLREDRIVEAERVIDLLRVEELDEFLGGVRSGDANVYLRSEEEQAWSEYAKMMQRSVTQGRELAQLLEDLEDRDPTVDAKIRELTAEMVEINTAFVEFNEDPEVVSAFDDLSPKSRDQSISPAHLVQLSQAIEGDAALFYPLILPDRLELVLATTYSLPIHIPIDVSEDELKDAIWEFRNALTGEPGYDPKVLGQKLYRWLIAPLEGALAAAEINRIIYIPDGPLRYVPLAALHDGENWLIRRYQINLITAMSLTNFSPTTRPISKVLAGAFPSEAIEVDVAGSRYLLEGLPFARQEVEDIASIYPDSSTFFGDEFSPQNLVPFFSGYQVVHLATHGRFVPGRPADESFILFGNGERTTLPEIKNSWLLRNIDLVVLSACETGLGGKLENGEEFLGFGYLMQNAGAKAIIASLWSVSDGGTQALMTAFYRYINQPGMSMADALRQAQLALIDDKHDVDGAARGVNLVEQPQAPKDFAHPVFWAPFVLIGNGL